MSLGYIYDLRCDIGGPMLELEPGILVSKNCYSTVRCEFGNCEIIPNYEKCPFYCYKNGDKFSPIFSKDNFIYNQLKWHHDNNTFSKDNK